MRKDRQSGPKKVIHYKIVKNCVLSRVEVCQLHYLF